MKNDEILLAILSGILLAFGIHEITRTSRPPLSHRTGLQRDSAALSKHWHRVGDYLRQGEEVERRRRGQETAA